VKGGDMTYLYYMCRKLTKFILCNKENYIYYAGESKIENSCMKDNGRMQIYYVKAIIMWNVSEKEFEAFQMRKLLRGWEFL
jgi:hypothetical protein